MEFYGRKEEIHLLNKVWKTAEMKARMTVITGRRRIGKTLLSLVYSQDKPHLYLFVAKKTEVLLCQEFLNQIKEKFSIPIVGDISTFRDIFTLLLEIARQQPFILIIDEVQEFLTINPTVFSEIQQLWDRYLFQSKIQLIMMGSIHSLMHKIFEDSQEPLFGRADRIIHLKPFKISEIGAILEHHGHGDNVETLFNYYLLSGGVPKYIEQLFTEKAFTEKEIFDFVFSEHSPFLDEGKNVLVEEFGKEYGMYFSILELIAFGKTGRSEIESILQKETGGYLDRLENYYGLLEKVRPIHAKPNTKSIKYRIKDLFLKFWFRFIYRNWSAVETSNFKYVKDVFYQSINVYRGMILEDFFRDLMIETKQFNKVGSYWDKNSDNEIDLVAINDFHKKIVVAEIKMNKNKIKMGLLKKKAEKLLIHYPDYTTRYLMLSLEDAFRVDSLL